MIFVIVTKCVLDKEGHHHSLQKDSSPLAKTPSDMPCIFFCVCRVCRALPNHRAKILMILCWAYVIVGATITAPFHTPFPTKINAMLENVATNMLPGCALPLFFIVELTILESSQNMSIFASTLCNFHSCFMSTCTPQLASPCLIHHGKHSE